ncbi:MAG: hypothetical protein ACKOE6_07335 [Flammeovirgaceae bacterium]
MNLENLKPAWRQFQLLNTMQPIREEEILFILSKAEVVSMSKAHKLVTSIIVFIILCYCCQGG